MVVSKTYSQLFCKTLRRHVAPGRFINLPASWEGTAKSRMYQTWIQKSPCHLSVEYRPFHLDYQRWRTPSMKCINWCKDHNEESRSVFGQYFRACSVVSIANRDIVWLWLIYMIAEDECTVWSDIAFLPLRADKNFKETRVAFVQVIEGGSPLTRWARNYVASVQGALLLMEWISTPSRIS